MSTSEENEQTRTGVSFMDAAHEAMSAALSRLGSTQDRDFGVAFSEFVAAVENDFRNEEDAMEAIAFAGLRGHREEHARVLCALHHAEPLVAAGDVCIGREALVLLPQWFKLHQVTMDLALSVALKNADIVSGDCLPRRQDCSNSSAGSGRR